ncbi:MAG: hypothetical protein LBO66_07100 [Deltaproteobacteria bacterium]|jgi:TPR repeat protein|nr:hypothetical protein [Deltaproteobacteria bacterium]
MEDEYASRLSQLRAWARAGDATAQYRLGEFFLEKENPLRDPRQALKLFRRSLAGGCVHASLAIGQIYLQGLLGKRSPAKGFQYVLKGAKAFDPKAFAPLGRLYWKGIGARENPREAFLWFSRAAEIHDSDAYYPLGKMCLLGEAGPPDPASALTWLLKARDADKGPPAETNRFLSRAYAYDFEVPESLDAYLPRMWEDMTWTFPEAALPIAQILLRDKNNPRFNPQKAKRVLKAAIKNSVTPAIRRLADFYAGPHASPKDRGKALALYKRGASLPSPCAQASFALYRIYSKGELGVKPDPKLALQHLQVAAQRRCLEAIFLLATLRDKGEGVRKSPRAAFQCLKTAAELGHVPAYFPLGEKYRRGQGTKENLKMAFFWTLKAAESGDERAYAPTARALWEGLGTEANPAEARRFEEKIPVENPRPAGGLFS